MSVFWRHHSGQNLSFKHHRVRRNYFRVIGTVQLKQTYTVRWDKPKISIWWSHWLSRFVVGLCISLVPVCILRYYWRMKILFKQNHFLKFCFCKCLVLFQWYNPLTGGKRKISVWCIHWLWLHLFGHCILVLESTYTTCKNTRCWWSTNVI